MPTAKKAPKSKKPAEKASAPKATAIKTALNSTQLIQTISAQSGVAAKDVKAVIAGLHAAMLGSVAKNAAGTFTLPGLFKATVVKVPAKPKRRGIDPFTKQERDFPAKPASVKVKIRPLKKLKDAAG